MRDLWKRTICPLSLRGLAFVNIVVVEACHVPKILAEEFK
jgi:hypothetical protein